MKVPIEDVKKLGRITDENLIKVYTSNDFTKISRKIISKICK